MPVSTRSQSGPLKGDEFYDAVLAWFEAYKQVLQEVERFNLQNHGLWILEEDIDILDSHLAQNSDDELVSSLSKPKSEERVHELELQLQQKLEIPVRQTAFEEYEALRKRFGELRERFRKEGSWISQWANHPKRLKVTPPFGLTPKQAIDLDFIVAKHISTTTFERMRKAYRATHNGDKNFALALHDETKRKRVFSVSPSPSPSPSPTPSPGPRGRTRRQARRRSLPTRSSSDNFSTSSSEPESRNSDGSWHGDLSLSRSRRHFPNSEGNYRKNLIYFG